MTPTRAFITGDSITANIEVDVFGVNWMENETCMVQMVFPDAISYIDSWSNMTEQDWTYVWWDYQSHDAVYAIYHENVTLWYVHDGIYGLNVTVWQPNLGQIGYNSYYYSNLVQIKPYSYIEEAKRTQVAQALNFEVLGVAIIATAPIFVQIVDALAEMHLPKKKE